MMATEKYLYAISYDFLWSGHVFATFFLYSYRPIRMSLSPLTSWITHFLDLESINCGDIRSAHYYIFRPIHLHTL